MKELVMWAIVVVGSGEPPQVILVKDEAHCLKGANALNIKYSQQLDVSCVTIDTTFLTEQS